MKCIPTFSFKYILLVHLIPLTKHKTVGAFNLENKKNLDKKIPPAVRPTKYGHNLKIRLEDFCSSISVLKNRKRLYFFRGSLDIPSLYLDFEIRLWEFYRFLTLGYFSKKSKSVSIHLKGKTDRQIDRYTDRQIDR